jgi:hypothetical protein
MSESQPTYQAIVEKVIRRGKHGPYAVASSTELGSVTFSLDPPVWNEEAYPDRGTYVVLSNIQKKRAGWRARHGRFLRPADEQPVTSNQQPAVSKEQ